MVAHLIDGEFQSDKYPTTPRGKVPLSVKDPTAQDLLWEYAQRRRAVDAEFSDDLEAALRAAGYVHQASANHKRRVATIAASIAGGLAQADSVGSCMDWQREQVAERSVDLAERILRKVGL